MTSAPYSFAEATEAASRASRAQHAAEEFVRESYKDYAQAEETYRVALAKRIVELRAEGVAATLAQDMAKGDPNVARLRMLRDVAEGVKEAATQAAWRRSADRRSTELFCGWSMRRDLAEGAGRQHVPDDGEVFGGRRA